MTIPSLSIKSSTLVAAAGEYYVLSRLCLAGFIAAHAPKGVPNVDIVVTDVGGTRLYAIQVKSRQSKGHDNGWHMKQKHEGLVSDRALYCFVDFGSGLDSYPTTYVVPSSVVAQVLSESHKIWLAKPGSKGQPHNDTEMRRFLPDYTLTMGEEASKYGNGWLDPYREAWNLLS